MGAKMKESNLEQSTFMLDRMGTTISPYHTDQFDRLSKRLLGNPVGIPFKEVMPMKLYNKNALIVSALTGLMTLTMILIMNTSHIKATRYYIFSLLAILLLICYLSFHTFSK